MYVHTFGWPIWPLQMCICVYTYIHVYTQYVYIWGFGYIRYPNPIYVCAYMGFRGTPEIPKHGSKLGYKKYPNSWYVCTSFWGTFCTPKTGYIDPVSYPGFGVGNRVLRPCFFDPIRGQKQGMYVTYGYPGYPGFRGIPGTRIWPGNRVS